MSFILEALKKSEKKHRNKGEASPRTIHEPVPRNSSKFRLGLAVLSILLVTGTALLFWFLGSWQRTSSLPTENISLASVPPEKSVEFQTNSSPAISSPRQNNNEPISSETQTSPVDIKKQPEVIKPLLVPRNEKRVYRFGQLPVSIQHRIPLMNMSLHAYNRGDASASMVQLNGKIMHEGDAVTDTIRLEQISADGAILNYDGYRFLLPRQGS